MAAHRSDLIHETYVIHGANMVYCALRCKRTKNLTLSDWGSGLELINLFGDFGLFNSFIWIFSYSPVK